MRLVIGSAVKTLVILLLTVSVKTQDQRFSPLQIPQKVSISAVMLNSTSFQMSLDYFALSNQTVDTLFCLRKMAIVQDQVANTCELGTSNQQGFLFAIFKCYRIFNSQNTNSWQSSQNNAEFDFENLFSIENQKGKSINSLTLIEDITQVMNVSNSLKTIPLNNFFELNSLYQLRTCTGYNQSTKVCVQMRTNYLHTYLHQNMVDNLIMQRNFNCFLTPQLENRRIFIFSGGAIRQNDWYYFFAVLITQTTGVINMWGGISYSLSHTLSDMFGFESKTGKSYDLFSLYASAPFQDIDPNINSTNDVIILANSFDAVHSDGKHYYIQYYRRYDTQDGKADDKLRDKIQITYCFVGYFDQNNTDRTYSPLDKAVKHSMRQCWKPSLLLISSNLKIFGLLLALMICLIF